MPFPFASQWGCFRNQRALFSTLLSHISYLLWMPKIIYNVKYHLLKSYVYYLIKLLCWIYKFIDKHFRNAILSIITSFHPCQVTFGMCEKYCTMSLNFFGDCFSPWVSSYLSGILTCTAGCQIISDGDAWGRSSIYILILC